MSCVEKGQVGLLQQLDGTCWMFDGGPRAKCDVCLGHCKFDMLARIGQKGRPFVVQQQAVCPPSQRQKKGLGMGVDVKASRKGS